MCLSYFNNEDNEEKRKQISLFYLSSDVLGSGVLSTLLLCLPDILQLGKVKWFAKFCFYFF